jgi:hypothetical protein
MRKLLIALLPLVAAAQNGLTVTNATGSVLNLAWSASSGFTGPTYMVYRCQGLGCSNFVPVGSTTATTYSDAALAHFTFYNYQIQAVSGSNLSPLGRIEGAWTVDLVLQSVSGDRCTAVATLTSNPLVTFTCNQASATNQPGTRVTTTINNVNNVSGGLEYATLGIGATLMCIVAVNEDPANGATAVFGNSAVPLPPSSIGYSCAADSSIIQGVLSPTLSAK